jgi:hypothetical protein
MSLFDSIFGSSSQNNQAINYFGAYGQNPSSMYNNSQAQMNSSMASQIASQAYTQAMMMNSQRMTKWMVHGEACANVQEFAKKLYPDDPESQMMLILRLGE